MEDETIMEIKQSVRFRDITVQFQTVLVNDVACLRLQDVQQRFPTVSALAINNTQLSFLCDNNGHNLQPLRVRARPHGVIEALEPIGQSNDLVNERLDRIVTDVQDVRKTNKLILANTQETLLRLKHVMTQISEIHEFTTPRYFFILPTKSDESTLKNTLFNPFHIQYKLYFLCECSDEPDKLHVAPHEGYTIKKTREFFAKYGSHLRTTLNVARALFVIGGLVLPQLGHLSIHAGNLMAPVGGTLHESHMGEKFTVIDQALDRIDRQSTSLDSSVLKAKKSQRVAMEGAQLRQLESYLQLIDRSHSLGNLYRTITDDGHVRWVCLEHYDTIGHSRKMLEHIRQFEAFGGTFDQSTHEGVINGMTITAKNIDTLCDALKKGFKILSLTFERCTLNESDLSKFFDAMINFSSIRRLIMSHTTIIVWSLLKNAEYFNGCMSVHITNNSLNVRFFERYQDGDIKLLVQLGMQNRICRMFDFYGGNFDGRASDLYPCLKTNEESKILTIKYVDNIEFICDFLAYKTSSIDHLKLSFWSSSPAILSHFCEVLGKNSTLTELSILDHHCFDDDDFTNELLTTLRQHKSIKRLHLHVYGIESSSRKEQCLINTLHHDSFLTSLYISESIISKPFIDALIDASQKVNSLMHLEFYACDINPRDVTALKVLHDAESLNYLNISTEEYWSVAVKNMRQQFQQGQFFRHGDWLAMLSSYCRNASL